MELQSESFPIRFGACSSQWSEHGDQIGLAVPVLAGDPDSRLPFEFGPAVRKDNWSIRESGSLVWAQGVLPVHGALNRPARCLYDDAFRIAGDRRLYRFWNFIPAINGETDGLEHYRSFGLGRHDAFVARFGSDTASAEMPAATGVGVVDDCLVVSFLAGRETPEHFENPNQVPAYSYPGQYGPKPPSFARATRVTIGGVGHFFLAGTSSVLGHASEGVGDLPRQIEVTLDNIEIMGARLGLGSALGRGQGLKRMFRIYLRRSSDLGRARATVERRLLDPADTVVWLQSDICRADLDIEIEATVAGQWG